MKVNLSWQIIAIKTRFVTAVAMTFSSFRGDRHDKLKKLPDNWHDKEKITAMTVDVAILLAIWVSWYLLRQLSQKVDVWPGISPRPFVQQSVYIRYSNH